MKISVIVPVYNTENYLRECLDSILNQTLQDTELFLVDDGSTDGSADIIREYAEKHPEKIQAFFKENGGQGSARNVAMQYATGEFLSFIDSDDWIDPEMYEEMVKKAEEDGADIVICDMVDHYPTREVYHHSSRFDDKFSVTPSASNKIFRREFVGDIRFPEGIWYEDFEFTTKNLMLTDKISVIHKGFYHCHCREVSTMVNNNAKKNLDMLAVFDHYISFLEEHSLTEQYATAMEYMHLDHILISTINRLEKQKSNEKKAVIQAMRKVIKERYPKFYKGAVYKAMPRNRRIIAYFNYIGLSGLSKVILNLKASFK